ncbi:MAG: tetraacyldisaccharide 4'-kinase [Bacteroidales bacterium]|jgi:tetraacyldisaccharide 4'-kinase|nr:tetraacyldisaccharide 4'-kinase [Bacteroidales bacterium]
MLDKILLFPYYLVLKLRNRRYGRPGAKYRYADAPTLCVGNVTVGGTGKTPHVEMVLRMLQQSPDWHDRHLAVLSRGYRRESTGFQQVVATGSASAFGDEPLQIKKKFPGVTVAVDKNRVEGCELLVHPEKLKSRKYARKCWNRDFPAADYIVLDDAFQYRKLKTNKTVVLVDWNRPVHKDLLLPLGRLRDLPERIFDADAVIVTKCPASLEGFARAEFVEGMGFTDYLPSACEALNPKGRRQLIFFTGVNYGQPTGVYATTEPRYLYAKKIVLATGIASDGPLRAYLSDFYKIIKRFNFPDHHRFAWKDISRIQDAVERNPTAAVLTTEKDVQRLLDYNGMPETLMQRLFYIPITVDFLFDDERELFKDFISAI